MLFTSKMCIRSFPQTQLKKELFQFASSSFSLKNVMLPYRRSCLLKVYIIPLHKKRRIDEKEHIFEQIPLFYCLLKIIKDNYLFIDINTGKVALEQSHFLSDTLFQRLVIGHVCCHKILYSKTGRVEYGYLFVVFPSGFDACNDLPQLSIDISFRENT